MGQRTEVDTGAAEFLDISTSSDSYIITNENILPPPPPKKREIQGFYFKNINVYHISSFVY